MAFVVLSAPAVARVQADPAEAARIKAALVRHVADVKIAYKHLAGGVQFVNDIPKNPRCAVHCLAQCVFSEIAQRETSASRSAREGQGREGYHGPHSR
jgi:hypothetical protein